MGREKGKEVNVWDQTSPGERQEQGFKELYFEDGGIEITRAEHPSKCFIWVCEYVSPYQRNIWEDRRKKGRREEKKERNQEKND